MADETQAAQSVSEIKPSPIRLRHIFKHLAIAKKKLDERTAVKETISKQLAEVKERALERQPSKPEIEEAIARLEAKVNEVIDKEMSMMQRQQQEETLLATLQRKLDEMGISPVPKTEIKPLEDFEKISLKLQQSAEQVGNLREVVSGLKTVAPKQEAMEQEIQKIERQIQLLEKKYSELKKSGKYSAADLSSIANKITSHKKILQEIKNKK